jgi:hypothetical protein
MLVIREAQMNTFNDAARQEFELRLMRHLKETAGIPDNRLAEETQKAIKAATELGFRRECDVARYCDLMYRHTGGSTIDGLPKPARNILLAYGVEPAEKLDHLEKWAVANGAETTRHGGNLHQ